MEATQSENRISNDIDTALANESCTIIVGDALTELAKFPEKVFECCVTSPPYWGLRDYG
ncbi:MAG TPA: site-specific DNA-methyltransferase, partial [Blastocatellia bacterium]|nr:site-specific DNA-methyltransferase [Blastocatellia bacterium]